MLTFVPGATPGTGEGNRDQITLRGNNTTADFFIDGIRDDVQYFRDLYNVDRVEVLQGPQRDDLRARRRRRDRQPRASSARASRRYREALAVRRQRRAAFA